MDVRIQVQGDATNYNPDATNDDGNCVLNTGSDEPIVLDDDITGDETPLVEEKDNTMMYVLGGLAILIAVKMLK